MKLMMVMLENNGNHCHDDDFDDNDGVNGSTNHYNDDKLNFGNNNEHYWNHVESMAVVDETK